MFDCKYDYQKKVEYSSAEILSQILFSPFKKVAEVYVMDHQNLPAKISACSRIVHSVPEYQNG